MAFTSHDDIWVAHKLRKQAECLMAEPELDYCIGLVRAFLDRSITVPPPGLPSELLGVDVPGYLIETLLARRRALERAGYFHRSFRQAEDTEWYARARHVGFKRTVLDEVLVHKRLQGNSTTHTASPAHRV